MFAFFDVAPFKVDLICGDHGEYVARMQSGLSSVDLGSFERSQRISYKARKAERYLVSSGSRISD